MSLSAFIPLSHRVSRLFDPKIAVVENALADGPLGLSAASSAVEQSFFCDEGQNKVDVMMEELTLLHRR